jgi:hypothetical protein
MANLWETFKIPLEVSPEEEYRPEIEDKEPKKRRRREKETKKDVKEETVLITQNEAEILAMLESQPEAFVEPLVKPYAQDPADFLVPRESFVSDFVNMGRGTEAPTLFLMWGALWTLSTALGRNAWIKWFPKGLWPNLYVIFIAPAGICRKSFSIDLGKQILEESEKYWRDNMEAFQNSYRFITSKSSPGGLYMMLKPEQHIFIDQEHNAIVRKERGSKVVMAISELATFISKQQYNTGLVNNLTDLYDCKDKDSEITRDRGVEELENVYVTLAGAITPTGMEESIPKEALSGGFVSRSILVYQDLPTKIYPMPMHFDGFPTIPDLGKKLAWIAQENRGEYYFTPEAEVAFTQWYVEWKTRIITGDAGLREDENRRDILVRKTAMLMRAAEYRRGGDITLQNFKDAENLLDYTYKVSAKMMLNMGGSEFTKNLAKIKAYIQKKEVLTRKQLVTRYSSSIPSVEITRLVNQLIDQGEIVAEVAGKTIYHSIGNSKEVYHYTSIEEFYEKR